MSYDPAVVATGSTQLTAAPVRLKYSNVSNVAASTGVRLPPDLPRGAECFIKNSGASTLNIYPPYGYAIDGGTVNAATALAAAGLYRFVHDGAGGWWRY